MKKTIYLIGLICVLMVGMVSAELGPELVTDPGFDDTTKWTKDTNILVNFMGNSRMTSLGNLLDIWNNGRQNLPISAFKTYQISVEVKDANKNNLTIELGGVNSSRFPDHDIGPTPETVSFQITTINTEPLRIWFYIDLQHDLDSISVKEIITQPIDVYEFNPRVTKNGETILAYEMVFKVKKVDWLIRALNWIARVIG